MFINQLSIFLENRSGQLAEITNLLSENSFDLRAINIAETSDYGVLRLICERWDEAKNLLKENGFIVSCTQVCAIAVPDIVGGLSKVLDIISNENIDIDYMYSVFGQTGGKAYMIFRVKDAEKLQETFHLNGIEIVGEAQLGI